MRYQNTMKARGSLAMYLETEDAMMDVSDVHPESATALVWSKTICDGKTNSPRRGGAVLVSFLELPANKYNLMRDDAWVSILHGYLFLIKRWISNLCLDCIYRGYSIEDRWLLICSADETHTLDAAFSRSISRDCANNTPTKDTCSAHTTKISWDTKAFLFFIMKDLRGRKQWIGYRRILSCFNVAHFYFGMRGA